MKEHSLVNMKTLQLNNNQSEEVLLRIEYLKI